MLIQKTCNTKCDVIYTLNNGSNGSSKTVLYWFPKPFQSDEFVYFASGCNLVTNAIGMCPANPGSTAIIPKLRMRFKMFCCSASWRACQLDGSGPPQPFKFPILCLKMNVFYKQTVRKWLNKRSKVTKLTHHE